MELFSPKLVILSAPSGTGKTSIIRASLSIFPNLILSVSYTTRPPRENEVHGKDYFFVDRAEFERLKDKGEFVEYAEVYGNLYGTSKSFIQKAETDKKVVILDIDVQGALQLKALKDLKKCMVFIKPPSLEELEHRLTLRGTETPESLKRRLGEAKKELAQESEYDRIIINDQLKQAITDFIQTILEETIDFDRAKLLQSDDVLQEILPQGTSVHPELERIVQRLLASR